MTESPPPARRPLFAVAACLALAGCGATLAESRRPASAQDAFFAALASHCGNAYEGRLVSGDAADAAMQGRRMVMHVRECSDTRIAVPFHIQDADGGWDRSRTWLITRTGTGDGAGDGRGDVAGDGIGLRLKHDHRHEDGTHDAVTMYGGDTATGGTATTQDFPVDAESIAMFRANGLAASVTNVWRVEVDPARSEGAQFAYQLSRANRLFRVEFDLTDPVPPPPAPWGWE